MTFYACKKLLTLVEPAIFILSVYWAIVGLIEMIEKFGKIVCFTSNLGKINVYSVGFIFDSIKYYFSGSLISKASSSWLNMLNRITYVQVCTGWIGKG